MCRENPSEEEETFNSTGVEPTENAEEEGEQLEEEIDYIETGLTDGGEEGQDHQQPEEHDREVDPPQLRRSRRTKNPYWQCLQYNSIIERNPG